MFEKIKLWIGIHQCKYVGDKSMKLIEVKAAIDDINLWEVWQCSVCKLKWHFRRDTELEPFKLWHVII